MNQIKFNGFKLLLDNNLSDTDGKSLRFGDKVLIVGTNRSVKKTYFLGCSVSKNSLSVVDPRYPTHILHTPQNLVIKYQWEDTLNTDVLLKTLQKINIQIAEELGFDLYA